MFEPNLKIAMSKEKSFFTRLDWAAFWATTLVTFTVYFLTLGPSVGLEDSGELATAGDHLGVPHPPGYPFWTLCSWIFCRLFGWVEYMGHPNPAWCISLFSAVAGALAAGCTAMLIARSSRDFIIGDTSADESDGESFVPMVSFAGGVAGALTFSLSPVEWSQSTIVEIYSLNALFLMLVFLLSYRWMRQPSDRILWVTAFVFGLGLTNYQVLLFAIVPLALIILLKNLSMFRTVIIYLVPVALVYQLLQIGSLYRAQEGMSSDAIAKHVPILATKSCPSSTLLILGIAVFILGLVAVAVLKNRNREKARDLALYCGGAGALFILLACTLFSGPAEWTGVAAEIAPLIEPWRYAVIAALVAASAVAAVLSALEEDDSGTKSAKAGGYLAASAALGLVAVFFAFTAPSADLAGYTGKAYPWLKSKAMFWLSLAVLFALCRFTRRGMCFAVPVAALHISAFALLECGAMNGLSHPQSWWFWWPIVWNLVLLALTWIILPEGRSVAFAALFTQLGVSFYAYMPLVSDWRNPPMNWGYPRTWDGFKHAIQRGQYEAIGFHIPSLEQILNYFDDVRVQFTDWLIPFAVVPFAAAHWVVKRENRKSFWQWMVPALVCFFLMSFLLIALANVKGDLQDGFIQKVKFISSHAMLALWIGYGLVFAAVMTIAACMRRGFLGSKMLAPFLAVLMIFVSVVSPLVDNYCGEFHLGVNEVAFKLGGSEQNDHTFGWQFGAFQLEGAKAVSDQLTADEEPLPDPDWPEAMEPFSIFFGGTDPGRFVPTYMIYAARYRPDIYLITQNALADDTYMSVQRDLYGDEIWIPSKDDSADAFNIYVDEVRRGVRKPNGDLRIENGRVQVTGALGVMEINGILTRMMFDHDRLRRDFYIEESYVIPWMYPYLSPHGLIMKINRDPTNYDAATARKDRDFWDWYVRRLVGDKAYRRDFAAQKSFSKLRAAIAGLYVHQGRIAEAAQAFREACLLYPASPESTFRYAQDILLSRGRWDQILELMDYTDVIDPNNTRTGRMREYVSRMAMMQKQIKTLSEKRRAGKLTRNETYQLAESFTALGRTMEAAQLVRGFIDDAKTSQELLLIESIVFAAGLLGDAERALTRYLQLEPNGDAHVWVHLAKIQHRTGRAEAAVACVRKVLKLLGDRDFLGLVDKDQEFREIAKPLLSIRR